MADALPLVEKKKKKKVVTIALTLCVQTQYHRVDTTEEASRELILNESEHKVALQYKTLLWKDCPSGNCCHGSHNRAICRLFTWVEWIGTEWSGLDRSGVGGRFDERQRGR